MRQLSLSNLPKLVAVALVGPALLFCACNANESALTKTRMQVFAQVSSTSLDPNQVREQGPLTQKGKWQPVSDSSQWQQLSGRGQPLWIWLEYKGDPGQNRQLSISNVHYPMEVYWQGRVILRIQAQANLFQSWQSNLPAAGAHPDPVLIYMPVTGGFRPPRWILAEQVELEHMLLRRDVDLAIVGCIQLLLASLLWTLVFSRPRERYAILAFVVFLTLSGLYFLSRAETIRILFADWLPWSQLSSHLSILALIPLLVYCAIIVKRQCRAWRIGLSAAGLLLLLSYSISILQVGSAGIQTRLAWLGFGWILGIGVLALFSLYLFSVQSISSIIHALGMLAFVVCGLLDILQFLWQGPAWLPVNLSIWGTTLLALSNFAVLEFRFYQARQELESSNSQLFASNQAFNRFVPREFFTFLQKNQITAIQLGDNIEKEFTIMVTDVHEFTQLSESMTPVENFDFVNSYFSRIGPAITGNHGFIAKYMGDGVMALFDRSVDDALRCVQDIQNILYVYNNSRKARGRKPVRTGIGIHRGIVRLGIVGSPQRMQGDLFSDSANMAARVEGLTRIYGANTVLSESAWQAIQNPEEWQFRILDRVRLKGKNAPVGIYELLPWSPDETDEPKLATKAVFEAAVQAYRSQDFTGCAEMMQNVLAQDPADKAAQRYIDQAMYYAINGAPGEWDAVTVLDRKN
ncbi:MAG: adenylate/guanylate cyclase domain-containing protein [Leptospiraceae bacterium]|nr:adenylate/guanylate cyclase domain-containing protein [Leptospiraceae bacterium]